MSYWTATSYLITLNWQFGTENHRKKCWCRYGAKNVVNENVGVVARGVLLTIFERYRYCSSIKLLLRQNNMCNK